MISFNGLTIVGKETYGVHRYTLEILSELDNIVEKGTVEVIVPKDGEKKLSFNNIAVVEAGNIKSKNGFVKRIKKIIWNDYVFKKVVKKHKSISVDLTLNFPRFGCDIVAVHDCIPNLFPEYYKSFKDKLFRKTLLKRQKRAIKKAKYVVTVSNSAKQDILKIYKIPENKITIIPNAWQHLNRVQENVEILKKLGLEKKSYFFSLGSRSPNKNIQWIIEAARQNPELLFVISGSTMVFSSYNSIEKDSPKNVLFTGFLNDSELKTLMHYCRAFIQPSLYEGFGIPPLEAMSVGAKCIVSTASSLPEIYEQSVWYIDPRSYNNINICDIMSHEINENSLVLDKYSWRKSAKQLYDLINCFYKR